jgi:hypothetical protein
MRFRSLQSLRLTNVPPEYGCRLVKDVRKAFKHMGFFRVFYEDNSYTVVGEDREPEPLDLGMLRLENARRYAMAERQREPELRWLAGTFDLKPGEPLSPKEALFLQEFTVVVKVWSSHGIFTAAGAGTPPKEKVLFNFCAGGTAHRNIRKGEARELYGDVLEKLKQAYPRWAAALEDSALENR